MIKWKLFLYALISTDGCQISKTPVLHTSSSCAKFWRHCRSSGSCREFCCRWRCRQCYWWPPGAGGSSVITPQFSLRASQVCDSEWLTVPLSFIFILYFLDRRAGRVTAESWLLRTSMTTMSMWTPAETMKTMKTIKITRETRVSEISMWPNLPEGFSQKYI